VKKCPHGTAGVCDECGLAVALAACRQVLQRLLLIPEVSAAPLNPDVRTVDTPEWRIDERQQHPQTLVQQQRYGDTRIPQGVNQDEVITGKERAPSKQLSLHAHYLWRMQRAQAAKDSPELLALAAMATRDYIELVEPRNTKRDATERDAIERLLSDWHGCPSDEAAAWMAVPGQTRKGAKLWVRRQRILAGCDPEDGTAAEQTGLVARAVAMARAGSTMRTIAGELGVSLGRVQHILAGT
jgi:hypothetical protein